MVPRAISIRIIFINMFLRVFTSSSTVVIVNGPAQLTCNKPCFGEIKWVYVHMLTKIPVFPAGDAFKNRAELRFLAGNFSLHLNPVMYNDGGKYMCFCNGSELCHQILDVIAPVPMSAAVGVNLTITFLAHTKNTIAGHDIMYQCDKDGERVVKLQNGKMSYGPGFKGRVSMSLDKYKHGDLSLTIFNIQQSDRGTYRCKYRRDEPVQPEAVTLCITDCSTTGEEKTWPWWGILVENIVLLVLVLVGYLLFKKWQTRKAQEQSSSEQASLNSPCSDDPQNGGI